MFVVFLMLCESWLGSAKIISENARLVKTNSERPDTLRDARRGQT